MGRHGSGYGGASEIIDTWSLRLAERPEFERAFEDWCKVQRALCKESQNQQLQAQARVIEVGGQANRVRHRSINPPRAPRGP
eukprot:8946371-Alexandrium_andersonii.AAC.1